MRRDRNYKLYLEDIKECLNKIEEYTKNITKEDFEDNSQLQDAVTRRLEIIGEAVKNIPKSVREINPFIPWEKLSNFKILLVHFYFEVSANRICKIVERDIPEIKERINEIKLL